MITIPPTSSAIARVSRKARSAVGRLRADHREDGEREGDVGRRAGSPIPRAARPRPEVHGQVDQRGYADPARCGDHRHRRVGRPSQRPHHEFTLELEPGHEEEERQRAVGRPVLEVQRADRQVQEDGRTPPRRVRPEHADGGGHAGRRHRRRSPGAAGPRGRCSRPGRGPAGTGGGGRCSRRGSRVDDGHDAVDRNRRRADQTSRLTAAEPTNAAPPSPRCRVSTEIAPTQGKSRRSHEPVKPASPAAGDPTIGKLVTDATATSPP